MQLVERHLIIKGKELEEITHLSKNLYNYCNYQLRQSFIENSKKAKNGEEVIGSWILREYSLSKQLLKENQIDYRSLPSQTSQQILKLLYKNWSSFFKSIKDYKKNPNKYKGIPKLPKYKNKKGRNIVIFTNQQCRIKDGYVLFPKSVNLNPIRTKVNNLQQVRIIPKGNSFVIEIVYEKGVRENDLDKSLYLGIDLGINNLATLVTNTGCYPILVNGKIIKSTNQYYNKRKARLMSFINDRGISNKIRNLDRVRENKINDYLHKVSRYIINYCLKNKIKNIVIGYNKGWKQEINIGKINNQKFVNIPYLTFISKLKYKAELEGINLITNEESYTSKCSFLDLENIGKKEVYLGKRVKRGLFQSEKLINADVNGAGNILRKVIGDDFVKNLINRGFVFNPIKVNIV